MQYGHCVVSATATAINSLYLSGIAPSLNAASSNATNPLKASGASSPSFLSFARFFMSYIATSLTESNPRPCARLRTSGCLTHEPHALPGRPQRMGHEPEVNERRLVTVPLLVLRAGRRVPHHRHLKSVLQEVPEVGFHAQVPGRASQNHLLDPPLAQLEHQV